MKKKLLFVVLLIAGLVVLKTNLAIAQGEWALAGNTLTGTEKLGSINDFPIRFFTNNTQRMTLTASGNLGIGTSVPEAYLHIVRGAAGKIVAAANSTLIVESSRTILSVYLPRVLRRVLFYLVVL